VTLSLTFFVPINIYKLMAINAIINDYKQ